MKKNKFFNKKNQQTEQSPEKYDDIVVNESLNLIAKGTGIILVGTIIGSILTAIFPIIIARYYTPVEFGIYALAMTVFLFLTRISYLGLDDGCSRNISFYRGKNDDEKVKAVVDSSFQLLILSSIILSILLFFSSDWISINIFDNKTLSTPLKILSASLPFFVLTGILISVFRGFDRANENVYFAHILTGIGKILLVIPVIVLGLSFNYVFLAIAANTVLVFLIALFYYQLKKPDEIRFKIAKKTPIKKELLFFSLPLVFSGMAWFLLQGTDKFMIGLIMKEEYDVGLYNAACTVSTYLNIFLVSIMFIYQPVGTKLFGAGKNLELKKLYQTITKWVFLLSSPVVMFVFLRPESTIYILYGQEYVGAAFSLLVLFVAYAIRICLGPAGGSVIMLGKTKQLMYIVALIAVANIVLNWVFIPIYGISGAAFATAISVILLSFIELGYLYKISKIQPIKKLYLKILGVYLFLMVFAYYLLNYTLAFTSITKVIIVVSSYVLFFVLLIVFRLFSAEDLMFVNIIEQKLGRKIPFIRKIIR